MSSDEIRIGIYKHFKGNFYRVFGVARHVDTGVRFVIYTPLKGDGKLVLREFDEFTGTLERDGKVHIRFEFVGENEPTE